jgi:hypothetical protein
MLIITVVGAWAAMTLVRIVESDTLLATISGSEGSYAGLQKSILGK